MNSIVQIRQISQYPDKDPVFPDDRVVIQEGGLGGPYRSATVANLVATALMLPNENGGTLDLELGVGQGLNWEGFPDARFWFGAINDDRFFFGRAVVMPALEVGSLSINGHMAATVEDINGFAANVVTSFNGRAGGVVLSDEDVRRAGGAPIWNAHFGGHITAPTPWDTRINDDTVATTAWVHRAIVETGVASFNGRTGCVTLTVCDINAAMVAAPSGVYPIAPTPALGDASNKIATTMFVDEGLLDLEQRLGPGVDIDDLSAYAPLNSPDFTGIPLAPTANPGTSTGQLATTAFVHAAVTAATAGVASFNGRTGAVTLSVSDVTGAGGAPASSPNLTGTPLAPTASPGTSTQQIATTAFVAAAIAAIGSGVTSFNGRSGAVTLVTADVTGAGGAPIAGPTFTGTVRAPTPAPATNDTTVATTAYVMAAVAAGTAGVTSFNSRTGAVTLLNADISAAGGALIASPAFTGTPAAPTAPTNTNTTQLATTAFVMNQIAASTGAGVTSFNTRTGAVTLVLADVMGAGGAPVASPAFTGAPTAPTALAASNDTTVATTAFVKAAIASAGGVTSFNSRTGAVTLAGGDISAAGGALIASPAFSGTPTAPTASPGNSTTQLATTAFVSAAITAGAVASFNGRNGAVTLTLADVMGAGGAPLASPTFTGTPNAPTQAPGTNDTTVATTAFVQAALGASGVTSVTAGAGLTGGGTGAVTLSIPTGGVALPMMANIPSNNLLGRFGAGSGPVVALAGSTVLNMIGAAPLASPTFTGTPAAPTAAFGTNSTQLATTAFVGNGYLPLTGGNLTGGLNIITSAGNDANMLLTKPGSGRACQVAAFNGSSERWAIALGDGTAESGGNVGSNFGVARFSDTGALIDSCMTISRSSGDVGFTGRLSSNGYAVRAGAGGALGGNYFNIEWRGGNTPHLWIDTFDAGVIAISSDYRIKKDVADLPGMWGRVKRLRPVSYTHRAFMIFEDDDVERWGFVAHELQETLTGSAASAEKDAPHAIQSPNPWPVLAALTKALQEAMERIEVLEAHHG